MFCIVIYSMNLHTGYPPQHIISSVLIFKAGTDVLHSNLLYEFAHWVSTTAHYFSSVNGYIHLVA